MYFDGPSKRPLSFPVERLLVRRMTVGFEGYNKAGLEHVEITSGARGKIQ